MDLERMDDAGGTGPAGDGHAKFMLSPRRQQLIERMDKAGWRPLAGSRNRARHSREIGPGLDRRQVGYERTGVVER